MLETYCLNSYIVICQDIVKKLRRGVASCQGIVSSKCCQKLSNKLISNVVNKSIKQLPIALSISQLTGRLESSQNISQDSQSRVPVNPSTAQLCAEHLKLLHPPHAADPLTATPLPHYLTT